LDSEFKMGGQLHQRLELPWIIQTLQQYSHSKETLPVSFIWEGTKIVHMSDSQKVVISRVPPHISMYTMIIHARRPESFRVAAMLIRCCCLNREICGRQWDRGWADVGQLWQVYMCCHFCRFVDTSWDVQLSRIWIAQAASFEKNKYQYSFFQIILWL
jgi:hypothetical protein